jgi:hypothetical protein
MQDGRWGLYWVGLGLSRRLEARDYKARGILIRIDDPGTLAFMHDKTCQARWANERKKSSRFNFEAATFLRNPIEVFVLWRIPLME